MHSAEGWEELLLPELERGAVEVANEERLDSWKEIAAHLRHSVRTVKRWERTEAMPVHLHTHNKLSSVLDINRESMLGGRPEAPNRTGYLRTLTRRLPSCRSRNRKS